MKINSTRSVCIRRFALMLIVLLQSFGVAWAINSETANTERHQNMVIGPKTENLALSGSSVFSLPTGSQITGPATICPGSTNAYSAPSGCSNYQWSITSGSGYATVTGSNNTASVVASNQCDKTFTLKVTYKDQSYQNKSLTLDVRIDDNEVPTVQPIPDLVVSCLSEVPASNINIVQASDNCGVASIVCEGETSTGTSCDKWITRTYKVTDKCGNCASVTHKIHVKDVTKPTADSIPDLTLSCNDPIPVASISLVNASDNCGSVTKTLFSEKTTGDNCSKLITRIYKVADQCGNYIFVRHRIYIKDLIKPTADSISDLNLSCNDPIPTANIALVHASDNCCTPTVTLLSETPSGDLCNKLITRIYKVTDQCGNFILVRHRIFIKDLIAPTLLGEIPVTYLQCNETLPTANLNLIKDYVSDNCCVPTISFVCDENVGSDPCDKVTKRTFKVEDHCGNWINVYQYFHIKDTIKPTLLGEVPAIYLQCNETVPGANLELIKQYVSDNCAVPTVTFVCDENVGNDPCDRVIKRTYKVEDLCGNWINVYHFIHIKDTIKPTLLGEIPAITLQCSETIPGANLELIKQYVSDNCCMPTVTFVCDENVGNDPCDKTVKRTFKVEDHCGNWINVYQWIHIKDTIKPTLLGEIPAITLQCSETVPGANLDLIKNYVSDNCGIPTVTFVCDENVGNDPCDKLVKRTFKVADPCGNWINVYQWIHIKDTIKPTLLGEIPAITLQCSETLPDANLDLIRQYVSDNCGVPTVTFVCDENVGYDPCDKLVKRTFKVADLCGNWINVYQWIHIKDTIAPTFEPLADLTISCEEEIPTANPSVVVAHDNCCMPTVTFVCDEVLEHNPCDKLIKRTYKVNDHCGNFVLAYQLIHVVDTTAPTFEPLPDITISCEGNIPSQNCAVVHATDNCCMPTVTFVCDEVLNRNSCDKLIKRTYKVEDHCGNFALVCQFIHVVDTIAPTAEPLADITVPCEEGIPAADTSIVVATDNCSDVTVSFVGDAPSGEGCDRSITRTYKVEDACGNETLVYQAIYINDTVAPEVEPLADITVSCEEGIPAADTSIVVATDNCSNVTVSFVGDVPSGEGCDRSITRTYKVADACGNEAFVNQTIYINDTIAPVAELLADITVSCENEVPAADTALVSASDNCSDVTVSFVGDVPMGEGCNRWIKRTYKVVDACENETLVNQVIYIKDTIAPVAEPLADITISCEEGIPAADTALVIASDNCSNVTVTFGEDVPQGEGCDRSILRSYLVEDACENQAWVYQTIHIVDTTAPTLTNLPPAVIEIGCDKLPTLTPPVATDLCDNQVSLNIWRSDNQLLGAPFTLPSTLVFYQAADQCGNLSEIFHVEVILRDPVTCEIEAPATAPMAGTTGNTLTVTFSGAVSSINWTLDATALANGYSITDGANTPTVTYTAGTGPATFTVTSEDAFGCTTTCSVPVESTNMGLYCTLTQGFYGNANGTYCDETPGMTLVSNLISQGPIVIGAAGNTFTINQGDAACIVAKLPGGGTPAVLSGAVNCDNTPSGMVNGQGRLNNILLAQTITLRLNMRLTPSLPGFQFPNGVFYTWESTGCDPNTSTPSGSAQQHTIPASVLALLPANPTVQDISNLADKALGNQLNNVNLGDINTVVSMINEVFDECKWASGSQGFGIITSVKPNLADNKKFGITAVAYPNPFNDVTNVNITSSQNVTSAVVEVYTLSGTKVASVYQGNLIAGQTYSFKLDMLTNSSVSSYVVVTRTEKGMKSIQILRTK